MPWKALFLVVLCFLCQGKLMAEICTVDAAPAAALLLPYFEVDLTSSEGVTTLFEINNASSASVVAHVVVWTDLAIPILDFNVYLTGYDVVPINMRDILDFVFPRTAGPATDPDGPEPNLSDLVSNRGVYSGAEEDYPTCDEQLPLPTFPEEQSEDTKAALTGEPVEGLDDQQAGVNYDDSTARGYVTVDNVNRCSLLFPGDAGYFQRTGGRGGSDRFTYSVVPGTRPGTGDSGVARSENVLWGNFYIVNPKESSAVGETLIHVEADTTDLETALSGQYTFYGRLAGWTAVDHREPLGSSFAVRFIHNSAFTGGTDLIVWRDPKVPVSPFNPEDFPPFPFRLGQEAIIVFDEEENADIPEQSPISPQPDVPMLNPFPWATQRVTVGSPALPVPFNSGWIYLNLNAGDINGNPPEDPFASQNWVLVLASAEGRFSAGFDAIQLDSTCNANHLDPDENPAIGGSGDDDTSP